MLCWNSFDKKTAAVRSRSSERFEALGITLAEGSPNTLSPAATCPVYNAESPSVRVLSQVLNFSVILMNVVLPKKIFSEDASNFFKLKDFYDPFLEFFIGRGHSMRVSGALGQTFLAFTQLESLEV